MRICLLTILTLFSVTCPIAVAEAQRRPNIVFLLADDQCTYSMGCYGTPDVRTPNLDRLAQEGIVFDNHYDTTAICMASRASILTGKLEYRTGCNFEHGNLLREQAVPYHGYRQFGEIFDRHVAWSEKRTLLRKQKSGGEE